MEYIGQPPSSLSRIDKTVSTLADSIANSLTHESYNKRALVIAFIRIVSFGSGDVKISMRIKNVNQVLNPLIEKFYIVFKNKREREVSIAHSRVVTGTGDRPVRFGRGFLTGR